MRTKYFTATIILFSSILFIGLISCKQQKKNNQPEIQTVKQLYTCSMHPQIIRDAPGDCPICGMHLIKKISDSNVVDVDINTLLQPTNNFVVSAVPLAAIQLQDVPIVINALGSVAYDTREEGSIAAKFSGRIEKLYVHYRYQQIKKGQKIMDIYSPEILTAQQNLLFLLKKDEQNISLIDAAKQRLLLLGLNEMQLSKIIQTKTALLTVSVFSNYTGHIHEAGNYKMNTAQTGMKDISTLTEELPLKEGMYVKKGEPVFSVYDPSKAWIVLNIFGADQSLIKIGDEVIVSPETLHDKNFKARINFIEPFFRKDSKTVTARIYFDNSSLQIPIGSQVKSVINTKIKNTFWLPAESVLSLGFDKIVFLKEDAGFNAHKIKTGIAGNNKIQIIDGLTTHDSVAANAQYLMDSESFIKIKK
ncbi:MAG TPA: efflux RND transporter periplasmic adaptor subunit [Chitinophagaceae bacterium]|nr:efflux RND transporter periplasmic adaptor subunit [Chitinophagaceae bacterium]